MNNNMHLIGKGARKASQYKIDTKIKNNVLASYAKMLDKNKSLMFYKKYVKQLKLAIKKEYAVCVKDPQYFMKKYCVIQHPTKGKLKFDLYPFQRYSFFFLSEVLFE